MSVMNGNKDLYTNLKLQEKKKRYYSHFNNPHFSSMM